jgi:microtubule-associated protein-like 6
VGLFELTKGGLGGGGAKKGAPAKGGKGGAAAAAAAGGEESASGPGGSVMLFSIHNRDDGTIELKKRAVGCPSVAWINDVKFSPAGHKLVAGSHDKKLYSFGLPKDLPSNIDAEDWGSEWTDCLKTLKPVKVFDKHSSAVLHIDFSLDGLFMQTNCQAAELLFSHAESLNQETSATKMAEYNGQLEDATPARVWATQTCKLGWGVQGIWPPGADTSDINSVDRHCAGKLIASADDNGQVKIFRYPCVNEGAKFLALDGHSSHVTCVRWTVGHNLASVGGNDKCLFVWDMEEK